MEQLKIAKVIEDTKTILCEYNLCDDCLGRMFASKLRVLSRKKLGQKIRNLSKQRNPRICYICKNLMSKLDRYVQKLLELSQEYEFSTFLIGAIIQPSILDRDDTVRSKFKLQGIVSIKSDITREMGKRFASKTKTKVEYQNPDIVFTIDFKKDLFEIKPRAILLSGRYTKKIRGMPQKEKPCVQCSGRGCYYCNFHGISEFNSVEGKISAFLFQKFDAQQANINWIGSEDETSLVLGHGRPFFVKLINPHKRSFVFKRRISLDGVFVHNLKIIPKIPSDQIRFRTEVILEVETENELEPQILGELRHLTGKSILIHENFGRKNHKKIYKIKFKRKSAKAFLVNMDAEGGIPLKRFVTGSEVEPSLSSILKTQCKCKLFDFNKIILTN